MPQTANPYGSNVPAPIGHAAKTQANFFNKAESAGSGSIGGPNSNSFFGSDSKSQPAGAAKKQALQGKNHASVVADDYDDWDKDDSPQDTSSTSVNQRDGMAFFNRAPLS